jgi:hypothetical protein
VEGREDLFGGSLSMRTVLGRRSSGDPFADVVFQRDNAFVDAAFGRQVD